MGIGKGSLKAQHQDFHPLFARAIVPAMGRPRSGSAAVLALRLAMGAATSALASCQGCGKAPEGSPPAAAQCDTGDLDRRIAAVALREKAVELREQTVADREAKLREALVTPTPLAAPPPPAAKLRPVQGNQSAHSEQEAELAHRRVLNEMESKGLLSADLPADAARLDDQIYTALRAGEYDRAFDLTDRLGRAVAAVQVD